MRVNTQDNSMSCSVCAGVDLFRVLMAENKRTNGYNSFIFSLTKSLSYSSAEVSCINFHNIEKKGRHQIISKVEFCKPDMVNDIDSIALMEKLIQGHSSTGLNLIFDVLHHLVLIQFYARRAMSLCGENSAVSCIAGSHETRSLWYQLGGASEDRLSDLRAYFTELFGPAITLRVARYRHSDNRRRFAKSRLPFPLSRDPPMKDWRDSHYSHAPDRLVITLIGVPLSRFMRFIEDGIKKLVKNKLSGIFYSHCAIQIKYIIIRDIVSPEVQEYFNNNNFQSGARSSQAAIGKDELSGKAESSRFHMKLGVNSFILSRNNHYRLRCTQQIYLDS